MIHTSNLIIAGFIILIILLLIYWYKWLFSDVRRLAIYGAIIIALAYISYLENKAK
ncbi:MAG: hypothetical protein ABIL45_04350 [candidate division WOR-3 bacterium]